MWRKKNILILFLILVLGVILLKIGIKNIYEKKNIFFILIDTLRSDHLGCYGYKRNTSPNIDNIANRGIIFTNFYSVAPWTNPTIISLFSGYYPQKLLPPLPHSKAIRQVLPEEIETLAEIFNQNGYYTLALIDNPAINKQLNYNQGFKEFVEISGEKGYRKFFSDNYFVGTSPRRIFKELSIRLEKNKKNRFFVYLHLIYPHQPYVPPPPFREMFGPGPERISVEEKEKVINAYDGEIRYTDKLIGEIFNYLKSQKLLNNTYIIITADHGEGFWEHGLWEHGNSLFNELLKVPLIIYPPKGRKKAQKIDELASFIDLFPTIIDLAKIKISKNVDGESLTRYWKNQGRKTKIIFSESPHSLSIYGLSCQTEKYKLIYSPREPISNYNSALKDISLGKFTQLYDIESDPQERNNLANIKKDILIFLGNALISHKITNDRKRRSIKQKKRDLDEDTIKRLKSLGYLN
ncbi:MAG TPA: hypothetical protein ENI31_07800 [Candidatus Omnitrophica bacterium]|nr:hypothetical protein [Candidatus Omnitrophota bacterium]